MDFIAPADDDEQQQQQLSGATRVMIERKSSSSLSSRSIVVVHDYASNAYDESTTMTTKTKTTSATTSTTTTTTTAANCSQVANENIQVCVGADSLRQTYRNERARHDGADGVQVFSSENNNLHQQQLNNRQIPVANVELLPTSTTPNKQQQLQEQQSVNNNANLEHQLRNCTNYNLIAGNDDDDDDDDDDKTELKYSQKPVAVTTSPVLMDNNNGKMSNDYGTTTTQLKPSLTNQINRANFYNQLGFQVSAGKKGSLIISNNNRQLNNNNNNKHNSGDSYCYNRQYPAVSSSGSGGGNREILSKRNDINNYQNNNINYQRQNQEEHENILLFATEHDRHAPQSMRNSPNGKGHNGRVTNERGQQQAATPKRTAGNGGALQMTKTKSATLPANAKNNGDDDDDDEYDEIRLVTTNNSPQNCRINNDQHQNVINNTNNSTGQHRSRPQFRSSVRSISTNAKAGGTESHSYLSFGSPSQRASRSSLSASRVGKFVNYYPATRQPQGSRSPSHKRHTSPYAFHVPPYRQRSLSRTRSPPPAVYYPPQQHQHYYYGPAAAPETSDYYNCQDYDENQEVVDQVKQARYGYVAPIERIVESRNNISEKKSNNVEKELLPPASKFNNSLRSRTIAHIPSMVQVSVEDNSLARQQQQQQLSPLATNNIIHNKQVRLPPLDDPNYYYNSNLINRSEGDLLKSHVIAWRHSDKFDFGHDNPFKPGTELSWEADLMVRLMKRGYPLDELPSLVEATKEVVNQKNITSSQASGGGGMRSKSCDRLGAMVSTNVNSGGGGYLKTNLSQRRQQFNTNTTASGHIIDYDEHQYDVKMVPPPSSKSHANLLDHLEEKINNNSSRQFDELEPCKRIWANSLSRAKSLPRFQHSTSGGGGGGGEGQSQVVDSKTLTLSKSQAANLAAATRQSNNETDSLDELITSIEQEISDLLVSQQKEKVISTSEQVADKSSQVVSRVSPKSRKSTKLKVEKFSLIKDGNGGVQLLEQQNKQSSPLRKVKKQLSEESSPSRRRNKSQVTQQQRRQDLSSSKSTGELASQKTRPTAIVVRKKSRCCHIQ